MAPKVVSDFCLRTWVVLSCVLALAAHASPLGRQTLRGHVSKAVTQSKPIGSLAETNRLRLALGLPVRHPAEFAALLRELYDPSSAQFHHYLKAGEFASRFGPTEEDYATLSAFARAHGLNVVHTHANRLLLDVEGSVASVKEAFHVNLNVYQHPTEKRTFYAPGSEPTIEADLPLQHISGLDNYQLPKPMLVARSGLDHGNTASGSGPSGNFQGHDFRSIYAPGVTLDGAGQAVALVEFDTYYPKDITSYENSAGLPAVPITQVPIDGFGGSPGGGNVEVALDIETAISMAPGLAQVLVYQSFGGDPSADDDLLNQIAVDDLASQISCCWLMPIDSTSDTIFQQMVAQGQSFFNACGDSGAFYYDAPPLQTDVNITVVGGTTLTSSGKGGTWISETVWNGFTNANYSPGAGGSGGVSSTYFIPYWQQPVNMSSNGGSTFWRNVPDVAMVADQVWVIADNGQAASVGGTSCATPLWAGFTALINQQAAQNGRPPVGFLNPALYGSAQSTLYSSLFHDITTGNNTNNSGSTKFFAVPGYDLCTGWGTPTGQALINALAPPDSLELAPGGGSVFDATNSVPLFGLSQTLVMKSTEVSTVDWLLGPRPNWLAVSATHGVISNSLATFVTLSLNAAATNLPPGAYLVDLLVSNLTSGVTHIFPVSLRVSDPLLISPSLGMAVAGPVGGPFTPASQTFYLGNPTLGPLNWTAQCTSNLATFVPASGTLASGAITHIVATLNPAASNLLICAQAGSLLFTDLTTANVQTQPFTLAVGNGGFETGDFSDWTFSGNTNDNFVGAVLEGWGDYVHTGEFAGILGAVSSTASLTQTLPTAPGNPYLVSLFLDNPVGPLTNEFVVKWGGTTLFFQTNVAQMLWTNLIFAVSATNAETTLELDFRNDYDAFGLDDVSVTPMTPITFSSIVASNSELYFQWNATPGYAYRLEYTTDLSSRQWSEVPTLVKATNSVVTTSVLQPSSSQRFYRLLLTSP